MADEKPNPAPKPAASEQAAQRAEDKAAVERKNEREAGGLTDPIAPYAPKTNQVEGVDVMIARDGSGAVQVEPYADEYPADAKVEPGLSQINTRNQQAVGAPIGTGYTPPVDPPVAMAAIYEGITATEESRQKAIDETREAFEDHGSKRTRAAGIDDEDLPVPNDHAS